MHLLSRSVLVLASVTFVAACSDSPSISLSHASRAGQPAASSATKSGGTATSPAASPAQASATDTAAPAAAPTASAPKPPATPLRTNVCENPTCTAQPGACGCTAIQTDGTTVAMDCQDGLCTCTTGDQVTTQVSDDNCASDGEARTLYSANCGCL